MTASRRRTHWHIAECDVAAHVRSFPEPGRDPDALTGRLLAVPLPSPHAPLWDVWVLPSPDGTWYRLCFRAHHGLLDGVGIAHTVVGLLADEPVEGPYPHRPGRPTVAAGLHLARETGASLRPVRGWEPLSGPGGEERAWCFGDVAEARLRRLADGFGGTVNDVFLGALSGALRAWSEGCRAVRPRTDLPVSMPMSVRRAEEAVLPGNRLTFARVWLPTSEEDPRRVMDTVVRATRRLSRTHYRDTASPLYTAWGVSRVAAAHLRGAWRRTPVASSHVRLPSAFRCFGAPVTAAARLPVLGRGLRCFAGLTRVAGTARFAVVHDVDLPGAGELPELWLRALAGLEAVAPDGAPGRPSAPSPHGSPHTSSGPSPAPYDVIAPASAASPRPDHR
ncbi:wax ester/triacylglycerol synthase domain-containing protein [Streptomyces coeruleoprunus]|uniref:Wax ester/triacylglycerol synthase domain-containing protein n=1 Tax=Streptomyces coeruleoprunus TaxID=285563 RepID=A0ABV9XJ49_9ACTN